MGKRNEDEREKMQTEQKEQNVKTEEAVPAQEIPVQPDERDEKIKKLEEELETVKNQYVRTLAEYDNYRKRTEREKLCIYNDATADVIMALLPIADNMDRAVEQKNANAEDVCKGIEMIMNQLKESLQKLGVEEMAGAGEEFNPDLHNAVSHIEDESLGENVITQVFQKGYLRGDQVIRHAMVQVAN